MPCCHGILYHDGNYHGMSPTPPIDPTPESSKAHRHRLLGISTQRLHCSSFLGVPYRILIIYLVKPKKGTTMETIGNSTRFVVLPSAKRREFPDTRRVYTYRDIQGESNAELR